MRGYVVNCELRSQFTVGAICREQIASHAVRPGGVRAMDGAQQSPGRHRRTDRALGRKRRVDHIKQQQESNDEQHP